MVMMIIAATKLEIPNNKYLFLGSLVLKCLALSYMGMGASVSVQYECDVLDLANMKKIRHGDTTPYFNKFKSKCNFNENEV